MPSPRRVLDLPPPFRLVALREAGDAFGHACSHAGELGAGALVFVGRFDIAEFAVVLEPDEPLATARRCFYAAMTALADALAGLAPPEAPIAIEWPDAIEVDGDLVGGGRLGWPPDAAEDAIPDWLVFAAAIRLVSPRRAGAAVQPWSTALADEGFGDSLAERLVEGFARHLMAAIHAWQEGDFTSIAESCVARLPRRVGQRHAIAPNGDLRVERRGEPAEHRELRTALSAQPCWLDPASGGPRW